MNANEAWLTVAELCSSYAAASNSGQPELYASQFTEDVIWMPPGADICHGVAEIETADRTANEFRRLDISATVADAIPISDTDIVATIDISGSAIVTADGSSRPVDLKMMWLLKRQNGGGWKIRRQIWNQKKGAN